MCLVKYALLFFQAILQTINVYDFPILYIWNACQKIPSF